MKPFQLEAAITAALNLGQSVALKDSTGEVFRPTPSRFFSVSEGRFTGFAHSAATCDGEVDDLAIAEIQIGLEGDWISVQPA